MDECDRGQLLGCLTRGETADLRKVRVRLEEIQSIDDCIHLEVSRGQEATLIAGLADPDAMVRAAAAETLGRLGEMAAPHVERVARLLRDEDGFCRFRAAEALGNIGPAARALTGALAESLLDDKVRVREAAAWALREVRAVEGPASDAAAGPSAGERPSRGAEAPGAAAAGLSGTGQLPGAAAAGGRPPLGAEATGVSHGTELPSAALPGPRREGPSGSAKPAYDVDLEESE